MKLSVCIPVYNGARTIGLLVESVTRVCEGHELEIVLVNDGSRDASEEVCNELAARFPHVTAITLRRNFGEHNAVMCALAHCTGDYAAIIDDDFQNPPEEIERLLAEAQKGYNVVYSKYRVKKHSVFRNLGSRFNDVVATALIRKPRDLYLSSFKVIARPIIDEILKYRGPFPYIDGLIPRAAASISSVFGDVPSGTLRSIPKQASLGENEFKSSHLPACPDDAARTMGPSISAALRRRAQPDSRLPWQEAGDQEL
jgi:undecaprenyl-phosphate 4-deoxy-4-formamido-L-arabinose transferase